MEEILVGTTDRSIFVFIPDPTSTEGAGMTGLVAADLTVSYSRMETDNDATVTDVTSSLSDLGALTTSHTDWGWKEVSSTLAAGLYRLDPADAVFASGAWYAVVYVAITTGLAAATPKAFRLVAYTVEEVGAKTVNLPSDPADASVVAGLIATAQAVLDKVDDTLVDDSGIYQFTAHALELAPSGGSGSSAAWQIGTAYPGFPFVMVQAANPGLGATGLTVTATRWNGSAFEACENAPTEIGNGAYAIDFEIADAAASGSQSALFRFTAAAALDRFVTLMLAPA